MWVNPVKKPVIRVCSTLVPDGNKPVPDNNNNLLRNKVIRNTGG
jgi:hypothetical protein